MRVSKTTSSEDVRKKFCNITSDENAGEVNLLALSMSDSSPDQYQFLDNVIDKLSDLSKDENGGNPIF